MKPLVEGKTVFVTGGSGFLGSGLIGRLVESNRIVAYDNLTRDALQSKSFARHPNLTLVEGDVLDETRLGKSMAGADVVVHCAAVAGVDAVLKSPVTTMRVNMLGTANVLEAASRLPGCERVVCFSTSEVFGKEAFLADEAAGAVTGELGVARWTYAVSKLASEHLAIAYYQERGLPTTIVRPFNVYGPGQVGEGALRTFVLRALEDQVIQVHGNGTQVRAWCFVEDLLDGLECVVQDEKAIGESFNIGNQRAVVTVYELAKVVVRVLQSRSAIEFVRKEYTDVELRVPSVSKARDVLGFEAKVDLEEGIIRTAESYRSKARLRQQAALRPGSGS